MLQLVVSSAPPVVRSAVTTTTIRTWHQPWHKMSAIVCHAAIPTNSTSVSPAVAKAVAQSPPKETVDDTHPNQPSVADFLSPHTHATLSSMQPSYGRELASIITKSVFSIVTFVVIIVATVTIIAVQFDDEIYVSDGTCNIAVLPIEGVILPYTGLAEFELVTTPEMINAFLDAAEEDDNIKGVLIEINSPGGTPVASHRIAERIHTSSLPVVGLIGDIGASGGYMVAAASDFLIASPMSDVGGIGVNMSYVEESKKNEEEGLTYVQLMTGKFKDIGSPDRPITDEERALLQADLDIIHNEFIDIVTKYRELPRDQVVQVADGASMPGTRAMDRDLIDALGNRPEASAALAAYVDLPIEDITFCEYDRGFLLF